MELIKEKIMIKDQDPEFVAYSKHNMNHHIWVDEKGNENNLVNMSQKQKTDIYNGLLSEEIQILFQDKWKSILLESMNTSIF